MEDFSGVVVMHGILPFFTGSEIARLEVVSKRWKQAIQDHQRTLFQRALNRERTLKIGDYSSAGSDLILTIVSVKEIYKHQHAGHSLRIAAEVEMEKNRARAKDIIVVRKGTLVGCSLSVFPYFILLAGGMDSFLAMEAAVLVCVLGIPCLCGPWGVVFSSLNALSIFLLLEQTQPLFVQLAINVLGLFPQGLSVFFLIRWRRTSGITGLICLALCLLELVVADMFYVHFPIPVYWLPSLLLCVLRTAPAAFACDTFEREHYGHSVAGTAVFLVLECLFSFNVLPFFWLPYYTSVVTILSVLWVTLVVYSPRRPYALATFTMMFPIGFQLCYRVGVPLCSFLAFFFRVLPFLPCFCAYFLILTPKFECFRTRCALFAVGLLAVIMELSWATSGVTVQGMTNSCNSKLADSFLARFLVS